MSNADFAESAKWRLFDLRYRNVQVISKAQKVHLTTLLLQMTLLWTWYLSGGKEATIQGVTLRPEGIWSVVPSVLTFFLLLSSDQ
jgi:hypothetical protein